MNKQGTIHAYYPVTKNTPLQNVQHCLWLRCLVEKGAGFLTVPQLFKKRCQNVCNILMWICISEKQSDTAILAAFTAHHTPTLCKGTCRLTHNLLRSSNCYSDSSWIYQDKNQTSSLCRTSMESVSPAYRPWRYHFTKFISSVCV